MTDNPTLGRHGRKIIEALGVLVACVMLTTACATDQDGPLGDQEATPTTASTEDTSDDAPADEESEDDAAEDHEPDQSTGDASQAETSDDPAPPLAEPGRGVTDDTITIGFVYLDLDDLREQGIIDLNWGPQDEQMQVIVDHINDNGGIGGRELEVVSIAFDPVGTTGARSACLQLTEDTEVFAVVGAIRRDEVFCYTEQHDTIAIANSDLTAERVERSVAPYASVNASRERIIDLFVGDAVDAGLFDGRSVAVLSTDAIEVTETIAIPALADAGVVVEQEYLIQSDGTVGATAVELSAAAEAMKVQGIDTVVVVGDAILAVNSFIGADFAPTILFTDQGSASTTAGRADLASFEAIYTYGQPAAAERFDEAVFQSECVAPWNERNPDRAAINPAEVPDGEPNHGVGLQIACRVLAIFTAVADAAGPSLNNESFGAALDELGEFHLPGSETATLGTGKYDAEDNLRMAVFDPDAADDEPSFVPHTG